MYAEHDHRAHAHAPGTTEAPLLAARGLRFGYAGAEVLRGVDLDVNAGEVVAILGPNGVGKTTLLKCLNGLHSPNAGRIEIAGRDMAALTLRQLARQCAYVAQRSSAARLTVFDAILMGRKPHIRWAVDEANLRIVDSAIKRLGLTDLRMRHIDELSGGELQKVAIARALVQEPRVLLLDEPTSALDLANQVMILRLVRRVAREHGIAVAMTMHDVNSALRFADRLVFLRDGTVHEDAPPHAVECETVCAVYGLRVTLHEVQGRRVVIPD